MERARFDNGRTEVEIKRRNDKYYAIGWETLANGERRRVRQSLKTRNYDDALEALSLMYRKQVKLAQVYDLYAGRAKGHPASQQYVIRQLRDWYGELNVEELSPEVINKEMVVGRPGTWCLNTVRRGIGVTRAALNHALAEGLITKAVKVPMPSETKIDWRWLTEPERDRFINCCDLELRPLASFLFYTGARLSESLRVTWSDIQRITDKDDVQGYRVKLGNYKGKGGKYQERWVFLREDVLKGLKPARHDTFVLRRMDGRAWTRNSIHASWTMARHRGNFARVTRHDARHTFATHLAMRGASTRVICELLGHTDMKMARRYQHVAPSVGDAVIASM